MATVSSGPAGALGATADPSLRVPRLTIARRRDLVRSLDYLVSLHVAEELEDDNLTILDVESIVLSGAIVERQRDPRSREVKYVGRSTTLEGTTAEVVVKVGPTGKLFVVTVYVD